MDMVFGRNEVVHMGAETAAASMTLDKGEHVQLMLGINRVEIFYDFTEGQWVVTQNRNIASRVTSATAQSIVEPGQSLEDLHKAFVSR